MTLQEQIRYYNELSDLKREILTSKGNDYANHDRLSNFKDVAKLTGLSPERVAFVMICIKVVRLSNLLDKAAENESFQDSVLDLAIYADLLNMIISEDSSLQ